MDWASYVIEGDPGRPLGWPRLRCADGSLPGEVALLAFDDDLAEAVGVAHLVHHLINNELVPAEEILVLLRGDHNGMFSRPIKNARRTGHQLLRSRVVHRMLAEPENRRMLTTFRLLVNPRDSLAWASCSCSRRASAKPFLTTSMTVLAQRAFSSATHSLAGMNRVFLEAHDRQ